MLLVSASVIGLGAWTPSVLAAGGETPLKITYPFYPPAPKSQTQAEADLKSAGCVTCHTSTDRHTMHSNPGVILGCADCHGGNAKVNWEGEIPTYKYKPKADKYKPKTYKEKNSKKRKRGQPKD